MINTKDILETISMIEEENLDVRTITMGISLLDCCDSDIGRMCDRGVTHDPPRRTIWLHMNLPLYSPRAPAGGR